MDVDIPGSPRDIQLKVILVKGTSPQTPKTIATVATHY